MLKKLKKNLLIPAAAILLIATFQATSSYAQEQTVSESDATSTGKEDRPSDREIKKTLDRALDKIEAQAEVIRTQDEVIRAQDKRSEEESEARRELETENQFLREAQRATAESRDAERAARRIAEQSLSESEKRLREMEKKLKKKDDRMKWMAVGAAAALITIFVLK